MGYDENCNMECDDVFNDRMIVIFVIIENMKYEH